MKCTKCGSDMTYFRGLLEDGDYLECPGCGIRVYVNERMW